MTWTTTADVAEAEGIAKREERGLTGARAARVRPRGRENGGGGREGRRKVYNPASFFARSAESKANAQSDIR